MTITHQEVDASFLAFEQQLQPYTEATPSGNIIPPARILLNLKQGRPVGEQLQAAEAAVAQLERQLQTCWDNYTRYADKHRKKDHTDAKKVTERFHAYNALETRLKAIKTEVATIHAIHADKTYYEPASKAYAEMASLCAEPPNLMQLLNCTPSEDPLKANSVARAQKHLLTIKSHSESAAAGPIQSALKALYEHASKELAITARAWANACAAPDTASGRRAHTPTTVTAQEHTHQTSPQELFTAIQRDCMPAAAKTEHITLPPVLQGQRPPHQSDVDALGISDIHIGQWSLSGTYKQEARELRELLTSTAREVLKLRPMVDELVTDVFAGKGVPPSRIGEAFQPLHRLLWKCDASIAHLQKLLADFKQPPIPPKQLALLHRVLDTLRTELQIQEDMVHAIHLPTAPSTTGPLAE